MLDELSTKEGIENSRNMPLETKDRVALPAARIRKLKIQFDQLLATPRGTPGRMEKLRALRDQIGNAADQLAEARRGPKPKLGETLAGSKERGSISGRPIKPEGEEEPTTPEDRVKAANRTLRQAWGEAYDKTIGSSKVAEMGRKAVLGFEGADKLQQHIRPDIAPGLHKAVADLDLLRQEKEGYQKGLAKDDGAQVQALVKWARDNPELADKFHDLVHESTIARVDPSKDFKPLYSDATKAADPKKAAADTAREAYLTNRGGPMYEALGKEGQQHYQDLRDWYEKRSGMVDDAIEQRARDTGMDEDKIKEMMSALKKTSGKVDPYFALKRYGKLWARTRDAEGNTTGYIRRDKASEIKQWIDEQSKAQGFKRGDKAATGELRAEHGTALDDVRAEGERVAPKFLKDIVDMVPDDDLKADIYRRYIDSLPEGHYMKSKLPRAGTPGYSNDAIRAFATHANATSRALSTLKFAHKLDMKAQDIKDETRLLEKQHSANPDPQVHNEAQWGAAISDNLTKSRLAWLQSPHNATVDPEGLRRRFPLRTRRHALDRRKDLAAEPDLGKRQTRCRERFLSCRPYQSVGQVRLEKHDRSDLE